MRFKVCMICNLGNSNEQTATANNEKEAKMNVQALNPKSKVLEAMWVYK